MQGGGGGEDPLPAGGDAVAALVGHLGHERVSSQFGDWARAVVGRLTGGGPGGSVGGVGSIGWRLACTHD